MKTNLNYFFMLIFIAAGLLSCSDDEIKAPALDIEVTPLAVSLEPGEIVEFTIEVQGDLHSVTLNNETIKTYQKGMFEDVFTHVYTYPEDASGDMDLRFEVIDQRQEKIGVTGLVAYIMPDYLLADFSQKTSDEALWSDWWEGESLNPAPGATFVGVDGSSTTYLTCRGGFADSKWNFEADLPGGGTGVMMTRHSILEDGGGTAWSGYMIPVFGWYGDDIVKPSADQLDLANAGIRIIAIDVFYQTDPDSPKSFSDLSVPGKGVKFQFRLGNLVKFKASQDKAGWFMVKEAFVDKPDEWVTLYFNMDDESETDLIMDGNSNEVDFGWFIPAFGQDHWDSHKIFLTNFRITNVPE
jgi:hypothetical protein